MLEERIMRNVIRPILVFVGMAAVVGACGGGGGSSSSPPPNPMFVRASGSDGNKGGDPADAFKSISRAASLAQDGYTIYVGPGTYNESVAFTSTGAAPKGVQFIADPTGAQTDDAPGTVRIDATSTSGKAGFKFSNATFQTTAGGGQRPSVIDGFEITGATDGGIVLKTNSNQFVIQNCIVHNNPGDGIRAQDSSNVVVFNNLVYNNGGTGVGIVGTVSGSPEAQVYNNTIYGNASHGITVGTTAAASPGASVINNIVQANDTPPGPFNIKVITNHPSPANDSLIGYNGVCNLVYAATYDPTSIRNIQHDLGVDALFVAAPIDFHLQAASSAIDHSDPNACALLLPNSQAQLLRQRTATGSNTNPGPPDSGNLDLGYHYPRH